MDKIKKNFLLMCTTKDEDYIDDVEPYRKNDLSMAISCCSFLVPSYFFYRLKSYYMCSIFGTAIISSIGSDAIYHKNTTWDIIDRNVANLVFMSNIIFSARFFWLTKINVNWIPLFMTHMNLMYSAIYLIDKSRKFKIGSEEWRKSHFTWHWFSSYIPVISSSLSILYTGEIDLSEFINYIGYSVIAINFLQILNAWLLDINSINNSS